MIRGFIFGAIAIALSLLIALSAIEIGVRLLADDGMQYDLEMWKYARIAKRVSTAPKLGHEHAPNVSARLMGVDVEINSRGLRDREIPHERTPDTLRILMLGDSLTFGWGVRFEETTSKRLERLLTEAGRPAEVINAGVGNYNTAMEVEYFLTEGYKYSPDIVVLNYFINDAEPLPSYGHAGWVARNSYAYAFLSGRLDMLMRTFQDQKDWRGYYSGLYNDEAPGWATARERIEALARYCEEHGIKLLIVHYPELRQLQDYPFADVERRLRAEADRLGAPYLDLLESVREVEPSRLWVTVPDPHPNGYANELFADALYNKIVSLLPSSG